MTREPEGEPRERQGEPPPDPTAAPDDAQPPEADAGDDDEPLEDEPGEPGPPASVQFLGQYLLSRGLVRAEALEAALDFQLRNNLPIGALALSKGILSEKQLLTIHAEQWRSDEKFGEIAVNKGYVTRAQLDELLREQKEARVLLGEALLALGALDQRSLDAALEGYRESQVRAEAQVRQELRELPDFVLVSPAVQLTTRLLLRMGSIVAKVAAVSQDTRLAPFEHVFWQEVRGERPFTYALSMAGDDALELAEAMLYGMGEEPAVGDDVDEGVVDILKEFVNIIVGHVCTWLSRDGLNGMPVPPDAAAGATTIPTSWAEPTRRIHVRLVLARGEMALSLYVPAR